MTSLIEILYLNQPAFNTKILTRQHRNNVENLPVDLEKLARRATPPPTPGPSWPPP
jgi:hypothetical protein